MKPFGLPPECKSAIRETKKADSNIDWENDLLAPYKDYIKNKHLFIQNEECCYCRDHIGNTHQNGIHIEHILPKSKYNRFKFNTINLSVACAKCNLITKKDKDDFFRTNTSGKTFSSNRYHFIHPNIDKYQNHIRRIEINDGNIRICKYIMLQYSGKGIFTYNFFKLFEREETSLRDAQGIPYTQHLNVTGNTELERALNALLSALKE